MPYICTFIWFFGVICPFDATAGRVFLFFFKINFQVTNIWFIFVGTKSEKMKKEEQQLHDEQNPEALFCLTWNDLLCKIVSGEVDPVQLAKKELANRGLDASGKWVGFDNAAKIHGTK